MLDSRIIDLANFKVPTPKHWVKRFKNNFNVSKSVHFSAKPL